MNPHIHAQSSAKRYGGEMEDYLDLHTFMDSSKGHFPDNRHRALTHNTFFIRTVLPRVFGDTLVNSEGKTVSITQLGEDHVLEDHHHKYLPTAQDYLELLPYQDWMGSTKSTKTVPSSYKEHQKKDSTKKTRFVDLSRN